MARSRGRARSVVAVVALLACAIGGCAARETVGDRHSSPSSSNCTARVTPDCSGYSYSNPSPGAVVVTAPKGSGGNNREFFWSQEQRSEPDLTVCATFATGQGNDQQGIVLRLRMHPNGAVSAITVTRNVWLGIYDVFNFHVWSTTSGSSSSFRQFGSAVVTELPTRPAVYPLNMCARTVQADRVVEFVVWTNGEKKPGWGSLTQAGEAKIPDDAPSSGCGGWFAGHVAPGTSMTYSKLSIDGAVPRGLP